VPDERLGPARARRSDDENPVSDLEAVAAHTASMTETAARGDAE
jgi:hypothetical protein